MAHVQRLLVQVAQLQQHALALERAVQLLQRVQAFLSLVRGGGKFTPPPAPAAEPAQK